MFQRNSEKIKENRMILNKIENRVVELEFGLRNLQEKIDKINALPSEIKEQLSELILWKAKVTDMAIGKTPLGKEKMNRFGKRLFSAGQPTR